MTLHPLSQTLLVTLLVKLLDSGFHHTLNEDDDADLVLKLDKLVLLVHHALDVDNDAVLIFHHKLVLLEVHNTPAHHTLDEDRDAALVFEVDEVAVLELHKVAALPWLFEAVTPHQLPLLALVDELADIP